MPIGSAGSPARRTGDVVYGHEVKLNDSFRASTSLFCSQAFSALLEIVRQKKATPKLTECLTAFIKLLVGCYAQKMCSDVNDQVFEKAPDGISIFDDLSGLMQVEISQAGLVALEIVLEDTGIDVDVGTPDQLVFQELARSTLERLIEGCLDYQSLIDENFRFLFKPKAHWSNFTKIATFLHVVRSYLIEQADPCKVGRSQWTGILPRCAGLPFGGPRPRTSWGPAITPNWRNR